MANPDIAHVVVLMLENRSFDCMLGTLTPSGPGFDGLTGAESNAYQPTSGTAPPPVPAWASPTFTALDAVIPDPDPGELFVDMNAQLFGLNAPPTGRPSMSGFVDNYMRQPAADKPFDPRAVMHHFTPEQLPVMSTLARAFGVSDRWHASAPNQTWPNRFFVHCGTAAGYVNNSPPRFPYKMPTIYSRLMAAKRSWRIYFHDIPQTATLADIWAEAPFHMRSYPDAFARDAAAGNLPDYTFIEPRYFTDKLLGKMPNDQHPPHNVTYGEALIARTYNALRTGPGWKRTLFVVTYDEHGGIYDHVPPPAAVPPDALTPDGVVFNRYGVRVPALLISPWLSPGSVVRPPSGSPYPFDHTSILATLRTLYGPWAPLTARDAAAPDLLGALSLTSADNDGPGNIDVPDIQPNVGELAVAAARPPNHMQQALVQCASHLPTGVADIQSHIAALETTAFPVAMPTVEHALTYASAELKRFLG
jgi:phospholipase C